MMWTTTLWFTVNNVLFFYCKFWKFIFRTVSQIWNLSCFHFSKMFAEFCKNSNVVYSDFSVMINIFAPLSFSSFPIKLICWGFFNLVHLVKSIAINLHFFFLNKQNPINYQLCTHYFYSSQYFFHKFLLHFLLASQKNVLHQLTHWSLLFQHLVHNNVKKNLFKRSPPAFLANDKTNNLLTLVNVGSIKKFIVTLNSHFCPAFIPLHNSFKSWF